MGCVCDETVAKPARRFQQFTFLQELALSQLTGDLPSGSEDFIDHC